MGHRIQRSEVERIGEELSNLPALEDKLLSKFEAIEALAPTIARMRKGGHSLESIASLLATRHVTISAGTLKTYLQRLRKKRGARALHSRKHGQKQSVDDAKNRRSTETTTAQARLVGGAMTRRPVDPAKASFVVREDTEDI